MIKKVTAILLTVLLAIISPLITRPQTAQAAATNISVSEFAKELVIELNVQVVEESNASYIDALMNLGIIKSGDFADYTATLTRGDMLMLLSRADDYVNHPSIDTKLLNEVIEKRISDINNVAETKREDIAKGYIKGLMKGYSNGAYSSNRKLKLTSIVTKAGALSSLKMLKDNTLRVKISPDGQLIRTTNLPKYAKYFPYVLASYPNAYYDWQFRYEGQAKVNPETGERTPYKYLEEYASPADIDKITDFENFNDVKNQYLDVWVKKVKTHMECVFNVDYRTINEEWVNKIISSDYSYGDESLENRTKDKINQYIKNTKENKTVVESSKIVVDKSSLYYFRGSYVLRVYVKYRINSSVVKAGANADTLVNDNPYRKILYTRYPIVCLNDFSLGDWKESYFEVELSWYFIKKPERLGVYYSILDELLYNKRKVK